MSDAPLGKERDMDGGISISVISIEAHKRKRVRRFMTRSARQVERRQVKPGEEGNRTAGQAKPSSNSRRRLVVENESDTDEHDQTV